MKKRKIKLFASVASLAMVAAVMGVGVWAATSQAVGVTSTVSFTGTSIAAAIELGITGQETAEAKVIDNASTMNVVENYGTEASTVTAANNAIASTEIANFTKADVEANGATAAATVALTLLDGNGNGYIDDGSYVEYTFTITPATSNIGITSVTVSNVHADFTYYVDVTGSYGEADTNYTQASPTGSTSAITVKVKFEADKNLPDITQASLGDIVIGMTHVAQA